MRKGSILGLHTYVFKSECSREDYRTMRNYLMKAVDAEAINPVHLSFKEFGDSVEFTVKIVDDTVDGLLMQVAFVGMLIGGAMVES